MLISGDAKGCLLTVVNLILFAGTASWGLSSAFSSSRPSVITPTLFSRHSRASSTLLSGTYIACYYNHILNTWRSYVPIRNHFRSCSSRKLKFPRGTTALIVRGPHQSDLNNRIYKYGAVVLILIFEQNKRTKALGTLVDLDRTPHDSGRLNVQSSFCK